ncbi:MAG: orotidine 5'-phosphate decarboxylase / HUMPS family protein [Candidatus Methanofastidiosia archaeon]
MKRNLFQLRYGIIVACDVESIDRFRRILEETSSIEGIVGYKIGCLLVLRYGLSQLMETTKETTDLPVIYDHQKAGTDIPQLGEDFAQVCADGEVSGVIVFPQSGPVTEDAFISALLKRDLVPIVGGEMTHPKYLSNDGGFIREDAPMEIYRIAAEKHVDHFVVPGNKPEVIRKYYNMLSPIVKKPKYCLPGIGRQGGDIKSAFRYLEEAAAYAIIGSGIYRQKNMGDAARMFCREALDLI